MLMFKTVTTHQLMLLCISLIANTLRMLPANPASNCGTDVYRRVILTLDIQLVTALIAAVLLLAVWMAVSAAESNAVTASRMAVIAAECKVIAATRAHQEVAAAVVKGVGCIAAKWRRVSLRGTLLLAVNLSAQSCLLAVFAFEEWCMYQMGCDAGYGAGSPLSEFLMVLLVLMHGFPTWVAMSQN